MEQEETQEYPQRRRIVEYQPAVPQQHQQSVPQSSRTSPEKSTALPVFSVLSPAPECDSSIEEIKGQGPESIGPPAGVVEEKAPALAELHQAAVDASKTVHRRWSPLQSDSQVSQS